MSSTWTRTVLSVSWPASYALLATIAQPLTLSRVHFGWGFSGSIPSRANGQAFTNNVQVMGLVTTHGSSPVTPPNARTASGDAAPPTDRWLYWEARQPVLIGADDASGRQYLRDSGPQAPVDTKGQVATSSLPGGDNVYLYASWAPASTWSDDDSFVNMWLYASILAL